MTKVALSGAGGNVGQILRTELFKRGVDLRSGGGTRPLEPMVEGEDIMHGDLRDPAVVDRLLTGVDVLIHMAGTSVERPLPEIIENNIKALVEVYEGARRHKVRRIVFASSNHAFGMHSVNDKLRLDAAFRPDGFYGLSKVWGGHWRACTGTSTASRASRCGSGPQWESPQASSGSSVPGSVRRIWCN